MTRAVIAGFAVGVVLLTASCGGDSEHVEHKGPEGPAATTDVMPSRSDDHHDDHHQVQPAIRAYDPVRVAAFVASFRAQYPQLAVDRDDGDIAEIATESCEDLGNHVDADAVSSRIVARAAHAGRTPTAEQSREIFGLVATVCP